MIEVVGFPADAFLPSLFCGIWWRPHGLPWRLSCLQVRVNVARQR